MRNALFILLVLILAGCSQSLDRCEKGSKRYIFEKSTLENGDELAICIKKNQTVKNGETKTIEAYIFYIGEGTHSVSTSLYPVFLWYKDSDNSYGVGGSFNIPYNAEDVFDNFPLGSYEREEYIDGMPYQFEITSDDPHIYNIFVEEIPPSYPKGKWDLIIDFGVFHQSGYVRLTTEVPINIK